MRRLIFVIAAIVPGLTMAAAHYIPWIAAIGRPLYRLEAYAIGVFGIVGTSAGLLLAADGHADVKPKHAAVVMVLAAVSAGVATVLSWLADWLIEERHQRLDALEAANRHEQG